MLAAALQAEVAAYIEAHAHEVDEDGHRLVVRNGYAAPREVLTSSGAVEVLAPRVNDKRIEEPGGQRARFSSAILAPWCRKFPKINDVLPWPYLHGLSSNDFRPARDRGLPRLGEDDVGPGLCVGESFARVGQPGHDGHPRPASGVPNAWRSGAYLIEPAQVQVRAHCPAGAGCAHPSRHRRPSSCR